MSSEKCTNRLLKYTPFVSCIDPTFWHKLGAIKLDVDKLCEAEHSIWGFYSNKRQEGLNHLFYVDGSSFNREPDGSRLLGFGRIVNKNTMEGYKGIDKWELMRTEGVKFMKIIKESAIKNPSLLNIFTIVSFADLKQYIFYCKFIFLAPKFISFNIIGERKFLKDVMDHVQILQLYSDYSQLSPYNKSFFLIDLTGETPEVVTIKNGLPRIKDTSKWIFAFSDSSEMENPGWPLRNFLAFISYHLNDLVHAPITVLSFRLRLSRDSWYAGNSPLMNIKINTNDKFWERDLTGNDWVGWELNEKGAIATKVANLKPILDPVEMAETAVDLNLKLIKWNMVPNLDLDVVKQTKCLIIGAGTLGCGVARNLLSWGVKKITFVDCGTVSHSNPVRQSLYKMKDCGLPKAQAAAAALKEIHPTVDSRGVNIVIPMPGHPIGESLYAETKKNLKLIENLIDEHDVIFLLTDSRESRWLPTMLGAAKRKLVIDAALGFDSFLVMRHGLKTDEVPKYNDLGVTDGWNLGCYFCNDIALLGNTTAMRTLDQQCTVTRPGTSTMASGLAVELFVAILQHPLKGLAPAESDPYGKHDGLLGIIPHSIRGFVNEYSIITPMSIAFDCCLGCSVKVTDAYKENGIEFVMKAIESEQFLEKLTGLNELLNETRILDESALSCDMDSEPEI